MKKYNVVVNGRNYEVEIEDLGGSIGASVPKVSAPSAPSAPAPAPAPKVSTPRPVAVAGAGGEEIKAPMPGTILSINVKDGDSVKAGQDLLVFEAMKMENNIAAQADGTVAKVHVSVGDVVSSGDLLVEMA